MSQDPEFDKKLLADEGPHEKEVLEWWFVQGCYGNASGQKRYFMASIFKNQVKLNSKESDQGWLLLLSVLNPEKSQHDSLSRIDHTIHSLATPPDSGSRQGNLDRLLIETYGCEVRKYGPPRPISLADTSAVINENPLEIIWEDFSLRQLDDGFQIDFEEPESNRQCSFHLKPSRPRIFIDQTEAPRPDAMVYASYPAMNLVGFVDGEEVTGWAWLDHQWGNAGGWFFEAPEKERILGWDWLGVNLDNGVDLIVMVHRDMESLQPMSKYVMLRRDQDEPRFLQDFKLTPKRYWTSKETQINYPVQWELDIPEVGLNLNFEPFVDNQEIPVFGMIRAIWEGAGRVSGSMGDKSVSGRARLELHGYGFIFDFNSHLDGLINRIDKRIEEYLPKNIDEEQLQKYIGKPSWKHEPAAYTATISGPAWDMLSRQGKHWRPLFGIFMLEALGVSSDLYDRLICVIPELTHVGALIIDDIEDESLIRRGQECIHLRYGVDTALNAGNMLYFLPYLSIADHPHLTDSQRLKLYDIMVKKMSQAHFGQALDIYWSRNMTRENLKVWMNDSIGPKILQMYAYKTAAAVVGLAESACLIADAEDSLLDACTNFSRNFCVAFQIVDDVNNFSSSARWTKVRGEDISSGKLTYVIHRAMELLPNKKELRLQEIICTPELRSEPKILKEAIDLVCSSGSLEMCRSQARETMEKDWDELSKRLPSSEPKIMLRILCEKLLNVLHET